MFASAANPVKVATVAAFTVPVVLPSSVFNTDAASEVSLKVTASFPNPLIPDDECKEFKSDKVPVKAATDATLIVAVVFPSSALNAEASTEVSEIVILYAFPFPSRLVSVARSPCERVAVTTPDVAAAKVLASETDADPELTVTASFPNPLIPDDE